jgi:hypothetical protein
MNSFQEAKGFIEFTGDTALVVQYREESYGDLLQFFSKIPEEIDIIFVPHSVDEVTAFYGLDSPYGVGHFGRLFTIRNLENHFRSIFPYPIRGSVHSLPVKVKQNMEIAIDFFRFFIVSVYFICFLLFFSFFRFLHNRQALQVKPLQLDSLHLITEAYKQIENYDEILLLLKQAEYSFDHIEELQGTISNRSIASFYYKLALISSNVSFPPLNNKQFD